jgi:hypothetical protein
LKWLIVLAAVAVVFAALAVSKRTGVSAGFLSSLPRPEDGAPAVMISASKGEFPTQVFRLFADSATISPSGAAPISALAPIFEAASDCALVVTEREDGLAAYGALAITRDERTALANGNLPREWTRQFVMPELAKVDDSGLLKLSALNITSPLFIEPGDRVAWVADSRFDIERGRLARSGTEKGIDRKWSVEPRWGGHLAISDGGVIRAVITSFDNKPSRGNPITLEAAWRSENKQGYLNGPFSGESRWRLSGFENYIDRSFIGGLKKYDWSLADFFIPDPLIASFGVNLPNPGKNTDRFPEIIKALSGHLSKMGLKPLEAQNVLTGPAVLSLGGRTQILWFELPGIILELQGRGKAGHKLVEHFWNDTFMGAAPKPVQGYATGGTTDLPFTVLAAANDEKAVIGLASADAPQNGEVKKLLRAEKKALAWLFVDLPKLGASLAEMPSVNAILYEDEDRPVDSESTAMLQETLGKLGKLFVVWDSADAGRAAWY